MQAVLDEIPQKVSQITPEYLSCVLSHYFKTQVDMHSVSTECAVGKGENFTSNVTRFDCDVTIGNQRKHVHLVTKTSLESENGRLLPNSLNAFDRECYVYSQYLPYIQNHFQQDCFPWFYYGQENNGVGIVVLQDLSKEGFLMRDKFTPMNLSEVKAVVRTLGALHAQGHVVLRNTASPVFSYEFNPMTTSVIDDLVSATNESVLNIIKSELPEYAKFSDSIHKHLQTVNAYIFFRVDLRPHAFNTIIHGDCWSNNILFRMKDNNEMEVKLIDWQMTRISSGIMEICYFLYGATRSYFRRQYLFEILHLYLEVYRETLINCGVEDLECYNQKELMRLFEELAPYRFILSLLFFRITADKSIMQDTNLNSDTDYQFMKIEDTGDTPKLASEIKNIIDEFILEGFFGNDLDINKDP